MVKSIIITGIGGFAGTTCRFLISRYIHLNFITFFPWGTFVVNITGCLLMGILYGISERGGMAETAARLFLIVGFCGGFTTFSSLSNDAFLLLKDNEWWKLVSYTSLSFFTGLLAIYLGRIMIKVL